TSWLAYSYDVSFSQAYEWGVAPFLAWDISKIVVMAFVTTKIWSYTPLEESIDN
ncbi:MAG: biotin transporter BioY, partial [Euryarchaeota archaeon]|nr:biotin transporter BioY [Euryarchaeota archaeon]